MPKIAKEIKEENYREHEGDLLTRLFNYIYMDQPEWVIHVMFLVPLSIGMFVIFHDHLGF